MGRLRIKSRFNRFGRDEDGAVLIESILWFPIFFALFVMIADLSVLFMNQARIKKVMQDGQRQMAVGVIDDCADLQTWLSTQLSTFAPSAQIACSESATVSNARVSAAAGDLALTGASGLFGKLNVDVRMIYHQEVG